MKPTGRKKILLLFAGTAILSVLILLGWKGYLRIIFNSTEIKNELENELREKKEKQIAKNREMFSNSKKFEDVLNRDALTETETVVPHLEEPVEQSSDTRTTPKRVGQKRKVTESERSLENLSSGEAEIGSRGYYSVQTAALTNAEAAGKMTSQLCQEGFPAYIEEVELGNGKVLFRIRIGKYVARIDADGMLKQIVESGRTGFVAKQ